MTNYHNGATTDHNGRARTYWWLYTRLITLPALTSRPRNRSSRTKRSIHGNLCPTRRSTRLSSNLSTRLDSAQLVSTMINSTDLAVTRYGTLKGKGCGEGRPPRAEVAAPTATAPLARCYAFTIKRDLHDVQPHAGSECPWAFTIKKDPCDAQPHAVAGFAS